MAARGVRRPPAATATAECERRGCKRTDGLVGGCCSDTCLRANMDREDLPPVTVLSPNKAGGFGRDINRMERQPVHLPKSVAR